MTTRAAALAMFVLAGCGGASPVRNVYIDPAFTAVQATAARAGVQMWRDTSPDVLILNETTSESASDVRIYSESHCPHEMINGGSGNPDLADELHGVICVRADPYLEQTGYATDALRAKVVGHEMGHALGLPHMPEPSIMAAELDHQESMWPMPNDVMAIRNLYK